MDSVGRCAAELVDMVYQTHPEVSIDNTHILGFSLGAHTAALIASNLKTGKVPRLTGTEKTSHRTTSFSMMIRKLLIML